VGARTLAAAFSAGVDFIATDHYEEFAQVLSTTPRR
jgi:hypothetical protein